MIHFEPTGTGEVYPKTPVTIAAIILYHPCLEALASLIQCIRAQVDEICLVINAAQPGLLHALYGLGVNEGEILSIPMAHNVGVASAQNACIRYAIKNGFQRILLLDQDSMPASDMVSELSIALTHAPKAAAVGPSYTDPRQVIKSSFLRFEGLRLRRLSQHDGAVVAVDYLISSGCLISLSALSEIGLMRDDLFIDYVDIEWGLRANAKGYKIYGVFSAHMEHTLGEKPVTFFSLNVSMHSPLRNYYLFRNAILLYRENWIPLNWKLTDGWRLGRRLFFYLIFGGSFAKRVYMICLGLLHGISNRSGPIEKYS
jgi:rhamnosyltransferase